MNDSDMNEVKEERNSSKDKQEIRHSIFKPLQEAQCNEAHAQGN